MNRQRVNITILIAALVLIIGYLEWSGEDRAEPALQAHQQRAPDSYMRDSHSRVYDSQGQLRYQLHADRLEHYQSQDVVTLQDPLVTWVHANSDLWQIQASQGRLTQNGQRLELNEKVTIQRLPPAKPLQLTTEQLVLWPDQQLAESPIEVEIRSAKGQIRATGMKLFLSRQRLELLQQVRGLYEAP